MRKDRWLWAILILGAAVRLVGLGDRSLSYDECQQYWASQGNPLISNREITLDPPLFAVLLHFHSLAAHRESFLRLLPCLFGVLAIPAVYALARAASCDLATGRTAAWFFALAPYPIRYSQALRVYSLTLLLCALLPASWLRLRETGRLREAWRFALLLGAALLTMYGAVWLFLGIGLWLLADALRGAGRSTRPAFVAWVGGALIALPAYLLTLPQQIREGTPASFYDDKFLPLGGPGPALRFLARGTLDLAGYFSFIQPVAGVLFGLLALGGMAALARARPGRPVAFLLVFSAAAAAAASTLHRYPYGGTRQMLFAAPLFATCVAAGIEKLRSFRRGILSVALLAVIPLGSGVFLYRYHTEPGGQEMRPVARFLESHARPGDRILVNKDAVPQFRFYYHGAADRVVWGRETVIRDYLSEVNRILGSAPGSRWWLVFSHGWTDDRRRELASVDPRFVAGERMERHQAAAYLFVPRAAPGGAPSGGTQP